MIVILVIGVPGSGKTTFSNKLKEEYDKIHCTCSKIISFDEVKADIDWDDNSFKTIRKHAIDLISFHINQEKDNINHNIQSKHIVNPNLIIIDDIMFLKSMRREVYVMLRDLSISLLTIYVNTSIENCLERNNLRYGINRIPSDIINKIYNNFEIPNPSNIFDRNCLVLDNNIPTNSLQDIIEWILLTSSNEFINQQQSKDNHSIPTNKTNIVPKESLNKLLDIELRNIIAMLMKHINSSSSIYNNPIAIKDIGKSLSLMKSTMLSNIKSKSSIIPVSSDNMNNDNNGIILNQYIEQFISAVITKYPHITLDNINYQRSESIIDIRYYPDTKDYKII